MTDREVLENYRNVGMEMRLLQEHIRMLGALSGAEGRRPRDLTDEEMAERLRELDRMQAELDSRWRALRALQQRFEGLMERMPSIVDRALMRSYYGLGLSDEKTAEAMNLSRTCVYNHRHRCLRSLDAEGRSA